jgi:hypothetical protein
MHPRGDHEHLDRRVTLHACCRPDPAIEDTHHIIVHASCQFDMHQQLSYHVKSDTASCGAGTHPLMGALDPHSALLDLASIKLGLSGPLSRNRRGAPSASFVTTDPDPLSR